MALFYGDDLRDQNLPLISNYIAQPVDTPLATKTQMNPNPLGTWIGDWAWSLPLIVLTVVIHVCGLALIGGKFVSVLEKSVGRSRFIPKFAIVIGGTVLLATLLHGIEGAIWAAAYRFLGALPDARSAMLYSLSAMTSYGHANLFLKDRWQLMGALEALNGMLLFGLTTAFLFAIIQRAWPLGSRERN
ncbi:MAG: hypothetical protein ABSD30_06945 [Candidatus Binatus sp.]